MDISYMKPVLHIIIISVIIAINNSLTIDKDEAAPPVTQYLLDVSPCTSDTALASPANSSSSSS